MGSRFKDSCLQSGTETEYESLVDLGIVYFKREHECVAYLKLVEDKLVILAPKNHLWTTEGHVTAEDLTYDHLITHDLPFDDLVFDKLVVAPVGGISMPVTSSPTTDAVIELVRAGMGVTALNLWSVGPRLKRTALHPLVICGHHRRPPQPPGKSLHSSGSRSNLTTEPTRTRLPFVARGCYKQTREIETRSQN